MIYDMVQELQTIIHELPVSEESRKTWLNGMNIKKTMMSNRLQDYHSQIKKNYRKCKQLHILGQKDLTGKWNIRGSK